MRSTAVLPLLIAAACTSLGACAGVKTQSTTGSGGTTGNDASVGPNQDGATGFDFGTPDIMIAPPHSECGDGVRSQDEACDDHNVAGGDGCAADCLTVDPGYSCQPPGMPCHRIARCGDGVAVLPELCDDNNATAGDGCSATCKIEIGWKCSGNPSTCSHTTCGDKKVEGAEGCDDGNALPFDGCSAACQNEPDCKTTNGSCTSRCGDGIVVSEACDDGNNVDGDGCTAACKIEPGFMCMQPALGDRMVVPAVYRDFRSRMPTDFEPSATGRMAALTGMVQAMLDAEGKPVYVNVADSLVASATTFSQWYRDTPNVNHTTAGTLTLWSNGQGQYVNRYGPNGEQWIVTAPAYYCGNVGREMLDAAGNPIPCTSRDAATTNCTELDALGLMRLTCTVANGSYVATYQMAALDGTPFFFPVDADTFTPLNAAERVGAQAAPPYANWVAEAGMPKHNFHFTSEVRYWFQYDAARPYVLDFTGDDDVWVFINRRLAVDLGGIHTPVQGSVRFGMGQAAANTRFSLTNGQVYEVVVFQAERQTIGSSYRLTLSGFNAAPSECRPVCGDAILGIGEECDDGMNAGGYGRCAAGCKLGEYCGDGVVQMDYEDCDDGVNIGMPCPSGCKRLIVD
jgi:fibro-slime domain-containing protein